MFMKNFSTENSMETYRRLWTYVIQYKFIGFIAIIAMAMTALVEMTMVALIEPLMVHWLKHFLDPRLMNNARRPEL